jgi:signal transduction histidine kinase
VRTAAQSGPIHLLALPMRSRGRVVAVAVTGVDEAPYATALASVTRDGTLLAILAVLGATGLAALVLGRSLGPMTAMTERAADWSRHRSGSRFGLGPPRDELTGLAAVLDELLDRVEDAIAAEHRLTAEIAHELRSPLTLLIGEADLALMSRATASSEIPRYERIRDAATAMARAITALLDDAAAAAEGPPDTVALEAVAAAVATLDATVAVDLSGAPERVPVRLVRLERMLAPILDNAIAEAAKRVTVVVRADGEDVVIRIADDGPGIPASVVTSLFDPGVTTKPSGTGLGLALARRLVREAGGDIRVVSVKPAAFEVRLPRLIGDIDDEVLVSAGPSLALR